MGSIKFITKNLGSEMGANHYRDPLFRAHYDELQKGFLSEVTIYDVEDIVFPLSTSQMKIVDSLGRRVKLAGGNWSGGHMKRHCVAGLDERILGDMCKQIRFKFGMNVIRLTFSLEMFYANNVISRELIKANPELYGKKALDIFDLTIQKLTSTGLMVFLNNHTSKSMWCCSDSDGDGLWYTEDYSEKKFFDCWITLARRYKNNPRVIGADLRNEIRRGSGKTPTWGDGNPLTDWKMAAEKLGNIILEICPHWLIIVGGIQYQLDLTGVKDHPIKLKVPNKLVYSGHFYGFSWPLSFWNLHHGEEHFKEKFFNEQIYSRGLGDGVPFLLGQFGANSKDAPWPYLIKYLKELDLDWTYWCLDGYKCDVKEDETFGVWNYKFNAVRHPKMLEDMRSISRPKPQPE